MKGAFHIHCVGNSPKVIFFFLSIWRYFLPSLTNCYFVLLITCESLAYRPNQIHQDDHASRIIFSRKKHCQKSTFFVFVMKLKTCGISAKLDPHIPILRDDYYH